ncbi:PREDICTED: anaphase-promoting complex subunit 2 isoform X3 [Populus euphratica]|uniref:Anaphase-promoting complex subunit 2 n=1 Tax=Populus euphratica TaxID=75702 RepID=A0AAJ6TTY1_POPEU|nr:PREDICTED: anaphase-promoting complex subunit 2 isoform X3 [Populus euphratica]
MEESTLSLVSNLEILDTLSADSVQEIVGSYGSFCSATLSLLHGGDASDLFSHVQILCKHGLLSLVRDFFLKSLEEAFERNLASKFWRHFDCYSIVGANYETELQQVLCRALEEISLEKQYQEKCLLLLVRALLLEGKTDSDVEREYLFSKYQLMVSSVLMATLPRHFPELLHWYFKGRLEELSTIMDGEFNVGGDDASQDKDDMDLDEMGKMLHRNGAMDIDESCLQGKFTENNNFVKNIGKVVRDLRSLGFTSMTEDAYASAIFLLLKAKVHDLAGDDYRASVLGSINEWIKDVPLQFLHALLAYLGETTSYYSPSPGLRSPLASHPSACYPAINSPSEGLVRWHLRLEYFAYETLQDLRISKLFEIIVDYPDSSPAIEDLKQCLDYTGQHSKLVESFISALRYRLLTAAVGEPIKDYLRGRKDTIKCIVTMLTDGTGGNPNGSGITGDSLLEELNRDEESQENVGADDDFNTDDKQAWVNAASWVPDPVEADPLKGSRNQRKVDILGMIVGIIGSKDQLVNEYRVMLAEKLLNKSDYDIDSEIRTLELLKIHFGESSMQRCEIMLNDLIDSKRTNHNIKATIKSDQTGSEPAETGASMDILNATILSSNFWPPIQDEALNVPEPVNQLLTDYAKRFHEIKTPRKLLWKKNLGTVKLELQFEDRTMQLSVAPIHAAIIMQFQDQTSWTSSRLATVIGVPVDVLNRRINFWISKGILTESLGKDLNDHVFTLVEGIVDAGQNSGNTGSCEELLGGDEEGERSVASVEDQIRKEMTIYELNSALKEPAVKDMVFPPWIRVGGLISPKKFIMGMLTNFGSMALDRIHNTLKMFCVADPPYDKSLQQLQSFLSGLVSEEKLELRDGMYFLKK